MTSWAPHYEGDATGFSLRAHRCPLCGHWPQDFHPFENIVCRLVEPAVQFVFCLIGEPGPLGSIMQMADAEILFDNIAHLGYFFVPIDFKISEFGRG